MIARYGTGVDTVDVAAATRMGVQVTNAPSDWCADKVADHADGPAPRADPQGRSLQPTGQSRSLALEFRPSHPPHRGSVLGLLSFGAIAHRVAERMAAFGTKIRTHDPFQSDDEIRARNQKSV